MKSLQSKILNYNNSQKNNIILSDFFCQATNINKQFTDDTVLYLQEIFLQNGFHFLKIKNIKFGRKLLKIFLKSLNYYNNIAAISLKDILFYKKVSNIYHDLILSGYIDGISYSNFENFLLEHWFYDFLWIEASQDLLTSFWINPFLKKMKKLKFDKNIPILIFFYDKH